MPGTLKNQTAVAGIGATEFSKDSGRSTLQLACEAVAAAISDAGLHPSDVNGMVTYTGDQSSEIEVARNVGIPELTFFSTIGHGGGAACAIVHQAAMAIATGSADVVVCYRALNGRSGGRFGGGGAQGRAATNVPVGWYAPFGFNTPAAWVAMMARRYMHESGARSEHFGRVSVADRRHAAVNPAAYFYGKPITLEEHQSSRWIVEPLHLLDCCQESDGGVALVVTSVERARDLPNPPAVIRAAAQGAAHDQESMTSLYRETISGLPEMGIVARQLWQKTGLGPQDIQTAVLYDHFTPFTLIQLEEFGFCGRFEAKDFVQDGNIEIGGKLPVNTHGGQLGEAYIHGVNGISEGTRQIRGTSTNQVDGVEHVLVTAGTGVPTSALILGHDVR